MFYCRLRKQDANISELRYMLFFLHLQEPNLEDVPMLCGEVVEDDSYTKLKETLSNLPNYPESGNYSVQSVQCTQN